MPGLPVPPNPVSERSEKYQHRKLAARAPVATVESVCTKCGRHFSTRTRRRVDLDMRLVRDFVAIACTGSLVARPSSRPNSRLAAGTTRHAVPTLKQLALDGLVKGFEAKPTLAGIPPAFAPAVAQRLPVDLDPRLTVPAVHDENYWRRVCEEGWGWTKGKISLQDHGFSWKRAFCELYVAHMLENFGMYKDLPVGYEEEFCRPPIDGTHPRWPLLYPKSDKKRLDGKPNRERYALTAGEDSQELDSRILSAGDCGWPHLERLKTLTKQNQSLYESSVAWAGIDKKEHLAACASANKKYQDELANANKPPGPSEPAAAADPNVPPGPAVPLPPSLLAIPYSVAAEKKRREELMHAQRAEDVFDCGVESASSLREFVSPDQLAAWKASTAWPPATQRGDSIIATRAKELQTMLDRVAACEDYVFRLVLRELPSHLDLELITSRLPNLSALQLSYPPRHVGLAYDQRDQGMRQADADAVVRCLKTTDILTSLSLPSNAIDDGILAILMQGLLANRTVTHLDLSHNGVGDMGCGLLCKMLLGGSAACVITSVRLADNSIGPRGGEAIGAVLRRSDALVHVDLRLNQLGDVGGAAVMAGIAACNSRTLTSLSMANNNVGGQTAAAFAGVLASPSCALTSVDLAGNAIDEDGAQLIRSALQQGHGSSLCSLDLRANTGIRADTVAAITALVRANEVRARGGQTWPLQGSYSEAFQMDQAK